jgi:hypothetical protein
MNTHSILASKRASFITSHSSLLLHILLVLLYFTIKKMKFRPCIDLHSGQVKQIVGSTLTDVPVSEKSDLATNFETDRPAGKLVQFKFFYLPSRATLPLLRDY